ncbi:MAG: hypothetical protein ACKV2Q_36595 [Planctomycetaceae bacterium]
MNANHTPTPVPWAIAKYNPKRYGIGRAGITGGGAFFLLECVHDNADDPQNATDAAFIVRAVNAHAALVAERDSLRKALSDLLAYADRYSDEMCKIGRGAEQLGNGTDSMSVAGQARAALALSKGNENAI